VLAKKGLSQNQLILTYPKNIIPFRTKLFRIFSFFLLLYNFISLYIFSSLSPSFILLSRRTCVTTDGVWIGEWIY
jgi:hypothetical protein